MASARWHARRRPPQAFSCTLCDGAGTTHFTNTYFLCALLESCTVHQALQLATATHRVSSVSPMPVAGHGVGPSSCQHRRPARVAQDQSITSGRPPAPATLIQITSVQVGPKSPTQKTGRKLHPHRPSTYGHFALRDYTRTAGMNGSGTDIRAGPAADTQTDRHRNQVLRIEVVGRDAACCPLLM